MIVTAAALVILLFVAWKVLQRVLTAVSTVQTERQTAQRWTALAARLEAARQEADEASNELGGAEVRSSEGGVDV